jgi:hypothetical protein
MSPPHRRRRGVDRWHPREAEPLEPPSPVYQDGCYVISEAGESTTWALCEDGRWGVIYQCSGAQILAAWVDPQDLPLHVLAQALEGPSR